ncbi:lysostaphin resistance A-like protein [Arenimonas sp.]|uniref:CPBP family intramembrane glutamic endopeptidase n=1 Tax=Arenimonas sp. TaxID=1872635 RepID=UPI0035B081B8
MRTIFRDPNGQLRNGWWILIFLLFVLATRVVHAPLVAALKALDVPEAWRDPLPVLFVLLATWACTRLRREPLSSIGLELDRRWWRQLGAGFGLGMAALALAALLMMAVGGVQFELQPDRSASLLAWGLYGFVFAAALEELLFRGFLFQRLLDGIGVWGAQLLLAGLFALAHWGNPGMEGATRIWATVDIGLASMMLGLAYLRTRSLALPLGLHLGWNWMQGSVLGFGVSGHAAAGWWQPVFADAPAWMTGGDFGPEAGAFGLLVDLVMLVLLWRWKGRAPAPAPAMVPVPAS